MAQLYFEIFSDVLKATNKIWFYWRQLYANIIIAIFIEDKFFYIPSPFLYMSTFSLKITRELSPENPFTEWDCEPPLLSIYDGYREHYGTEKLASELLRSILDAKLSRKFKELAQEYPHIISEKDFQDKKENYGYTRPEYMRDAILWHAEDEREALSIACELSGTPYLSYTSRG